MNEIIKIGSYKGKPVISARELHAYLGSKQQYTDWINQRIEQYGFIEGQDYTTFHKIMKRETGSGASKRIEHGLTTNMAKELSMIENNDQGKKARKYFIDSDDQHNAMLKNPYDLDIAELHEKAALLIRNQLALEAKAKADAPKVVFADAVSGSEDLILIREFCKILSDEGFTIGEKKFYAWLRLNKYLTNRTIPRWNKKKQQFIQVHTNEPFQQYVDQKLFKVIQRGGVDDKGTRLSKTTKITGKGQIYFITKIRNQKK